MIAAELVHEPLRSLPPWVGGIIVASIFVAIAVGVRKLLLRALAGPDNNRDVGRQIARFVTLAIAVFGTLVALHVAEVRITPLLGALGIGGFAVAFAAQDILANFLAGVLIALRRPFKVGDQITSLDFEGTVRDIDFRAVRLHTYDGLDVVLPNAEVLRNAIRNHTTTLLRRTTLRVRVEHDANLRELRTVLKTAAQSAEGVSDTKPAVVWVESFDPYWTTLAVMFWHHSDMATVWRVRNNVALSVKDALDAGGLQMAYPRIAARPLDGADGDGDETTWS